MSEEQLKAFLEAVKADAGLQEKLKAAGDADAVVAIAKAEGFVISAEELKRAQAEVSEEELEGVAAGRAAGNHITAGDCFISSIRSCTVIVPEY
ncbi:nif11-like leader peptide domain protein [Synechococcus sp. PROS-7-1]|uniref:Nif11-like leader peptide family natural product precursor n=1 Tax=Synechococcus sp. PROS-7-1 TaxID=1442556 RepID=UPI001861BF9B|nr:Nif11-like leader peptide family natural product precursor [Synechococcus sp. PROS-7-1]QNI84242.1 nif11-like leader peptide domain protein [Synechococcus sp. PROS-7-1]